MGTGEPCTNPLWGLGSPVLMQSAIRRFFQLCNTVLRRNLFFIANVCSVNPSDLYSKMLVMKQMKYFDVQLDHAWKVRILQELLNTITNMLKDSIIT